MRIAKHGLKLWQQKCRALDSDSPSATLVDCLKNIGEHILFGLNNRIRKGFSTMEVMFHVTLLHIMTFLNLLKVSIKNQKMEYKKLANSPTKSCLLRTYVINILLPSVTRTF